MDLYRIAPRREHRAKALRYGTRSKQISQFYLHTSLSSAILPLPSQPKLVLIYRLRRNGRLSWPWVAGWLHTEINVRHRELNPDTVTHLSTNRAWRWLTSLIEANALTTTPDHQHAIIAGEITPRRFTDSIAVIGSYQYDSRNITEALHYAAKVTDSQFSIPHGS